MKKRVKVNLKIFNVYTDKIVFLKIWFYVFYFTFHLSTDVSS